MGERGPVNSFVMTPVGWVRSARREPGDTDHWASAVSTIEVAPRFGDECMTGLATFSHVEIVFVFDQVVERDNYRDLRPARGRADMPGVGISVAADRTVRTGSGSASAGSCGSIGVS